MNRAHERGHMVRISFRMHSMPEVEDMTGAFSITLQHDTRFLPDPLRRGEQGRGVKVALQCDRVTRAPARVAEILRPVDPDRVTAATRDFRVRTRALPIGESRVSSGRKQ